MTAQPGPKRKSDMRWQQGRRLYSVVCPSLPSSSHVAVLMYCWFNASGKDCRFSVAHCQIADATKLSMRTSKRIMADLEAAGVVKTVQPSIGRGKASHRVVTGKPFKVSRKGVMGDTPNEIKGVMGDTKRCHG